LPLIQFNVNFRDYLFIYVISYERFTVVKLSNWLLINVYMPCTCNRDLFTDILQDIQALLHAYPECKYLIGGDFNVSLDYSNPISNTVNSFLMDNNLYRCDVLFPVSSKFTYT